MLLLVLFHCWNRVRCPSALQTPAAWNLAEAVTSCCHVCDLGGESTATLWTARGVHGRRGNSRLHPGPLLANPGTDCHWLLTFGFR
jgi:hypothetical protein